MGLKQKLTKKFKSYPTTVKTFLIILLVMMVLVPIYRISGFGDQEMEKAERDYIKQTDTLTIVKNVVIIIPIKEEIKVRGPAWLFLMLTFGLVWLEKKLGRPRPLSEKILFFPRNKPIKIYHILFWLIIAYPTVLWAILHIYPLPIFIGGLIFGWLLLKTRSILKVILVHMLWNAYCLIGTFIRIWLF